MTPELKARLNKAVSAIRSGLYVSNSAMRGILTRIYDAGASGDTTPQEPQETLPAKDRTINWWENVAPNATLEEATEEIGWWREDWQKMGEALGFEKFADPDVMIEAAETYRGTLQYIFGNIDMSTWRRVLDEKLTPPWPLSHHAKAMGMPSRACDGYVETTPTPVDAPPPKFNPPPIAPAGKDHPIHHAARDYSVTIRKAVIEGEAVYEARIRELPDATVYADTAEDAYLTAIDAIETTAKILPERMPPPCDPSAPVGVEGPLSVFSSGTWTYSETGQTFSADELDEAAFTAYRQHLAQHPAARKPRATRDSPHFTNHGDSEAEFIEHEAIACTACGGSGHAKDQKPAAEEYSRQQIAWELERTAMGDGFYGNALRVAKDLPEATPQIKALLDRWATGGQEGVSDRTDLCAFALSIYGAGTDDPPPAKAQPVAYSRAPVDGRLHPITPREYAWLRRAGGGEGFRPLVYGDATQPTAEAQPGWYCAHCQRGVDAREVTYSEQHEVCGRYIANDAPPPSAPVGVERLSSLARRCKEEAERRAVESGEFFDRTGSLLMAAHRELSALAQQPAAVGEAAVRWAVERWNDEVANRPLVNVHRRTLDVTWRQVIRHFGGDDVTLCGPRHDDLPAQHGGES